MSIRSRTGRLGAALPVVAAVVAWLERAHAFGTIEAYLGEQAGLPFLIWDIAKLLRQVQADVESRLSHRSRPTVNTAVWKAVRQLAFRIELVLLLQGSTTTEQRVQLVEEEALLNYAHALLEEPDVGTHRDADDEIRRVDLDAMMRARVVLGARHLFVELVRASKARALIEGRYLGGHAALFPDTAAVDARLVTGAISLLNAAALIASVGSLRAEPGGKDLEIPDLRLSVLEDMAQAAAPIAASHLVELARISATSNVGDAERSSQLAERLVRSTYGSPPAATPPT
jgi:hypothetical protein